jgi:hypothetical protein
MRFIIIHKTSPRWEAGEIPSPELIARVGALIGELVKSGIFEAGEGLRASSEGVRLHFTGGERTVTKGPFAGHNELPAGFSIIRTASIDDAVAWATRAAKALGPNEPIEMDIRPVNEPWHIGMRPKPANLATHRYMVLRKATPGTEAGTSPSPAQRSALARLIDETTQSGVHLATESMRPSARGRRYVNSRNGVTMFDGPFLETKELIAGYSIITAASLDEAGRWAERYLDAVEADEVDVRELE